MILKVLGMFILGVLCVDNVMASSSFYKDGKEMGASFARTTWYSLGKECQNIDDFSTIFQETIDAKQKALRAKNRPSTFYDFNNGYIQGALKVGDIVVDKCVYGCKKLGRHIGKIIASVFCTTSKITGKTAVINRSLYDKPALICGNAYRTACEFNFYHYAKNQCPKYAKGVAFDIYYKAKYNGMCSYQPE